MNKQEKRYLRKEIIFYLLLITVMSIQRYCWISGKLKRNNSINQFNFSHQ